MTAESRGWPVPEVYSLGHMTGVTLDTAIQSANGTVLFRRCWNKREILCVDGFDPERMQGQNFNRHLGARRSKLL